MQKDFDKWNGSKKKIQQRGSTAPFNEREIWLCSLGLNIGSEQDGGQFFSRPVLVFKKFNNHIFWGIPLTTSFKKNSYYFEFKDLEKASAAVLSQLRLLSVNRMVTYIKTVEDEEFRLLILQMRDLFPNA